MKCNYRLFLAIALLLFLIPNVTAWWDNSWSYKINNDPNGTQRPYQLSINVSNNTGTNNNTYVFCNGRCNANFTDVRFTILDITEQPLWIENVTFINATTARFYVNLTTLGQVQMYYGNSGATTVSNGNTTFPLFDDFTNGTTLNTTLWTEGGSGTATVADGNITLIDPDYIRSNVQFGSGYFVRTRARWNTAGDVDDHWQVGFIGSLGTNDKTKMSVPLRSRPSPDNLYCMMGKAGTGYKENQYTFARSTTIWHIGEYQRGGTIDYCFSEDNSSQIFSSTKYANTASRYAAAEAWTSDVIVDWILVGNYSLTPPSWGTWGAQVSGHVTYEPPAPINGTRANGTTWTNYSWSAGTGNITDQYQVCVNLVCANQTAAYINSTLTSHQWNNLTVKAVNTSNNTMNSSSYLTDSYQNPNIAPVLGVIGNKKIYQDRTLSIQLSATDADNDTISNEYRFEGENYTNWTSSSWNIYAHASTSAGNTVYNNTAHTPISFNFNGTNINFVYIQAASRTKANISFDGGANTTMDEYGGSTIYQVETAYSFGLTPGAHIAKISPFMNGSIGIIDIDAIDVAMQGWYGTNATNGTLNTTTGAYTWTPNSSEVGNYTWYFNYSDGWGAVDTEVITVQVKANRLINVTLDNIGWQTILVNDTQSFLSLDTLLTPTYLAWWNGSSQEFHKYKADWLYRQNESVSSNNAVMALVATDHTVSLNISHPYNYTLLTGQNLIGFPENISMSNINSTVNYDGNCTNIDEINYIYSNQTLRTYSCVSGGNQTNASVIIEEGRGAWLNAVQNVTILDALG
jgi:hypothetical protein